MRISTLTSSFAIAAALSLPIAAQAQGFAQGWNKVQPTNCLFYPSSPAAGGQAAQPDQVQIFVNIVQNNNQTNGPPPIPDAADFMTSDPIAITLVAPFCDNGSAFYVYINGNSPQFFSIYPHS